MSLRAIVNRVVMQSLLGDKRLSGTHVKAYLCVFCRSINTGADHAKHWGMPRETFRRTIHQLSELGWIERLPDRRRGFLIVAWMPHQVEELVAAELAQHRENVAYLGEWLMRCFLDLIIDDDRYLDNARPPWLVSGQGGGRMELDRWYNAANVAFEFQGPQHYRPGDMYSESALVEQRARDNLKAGICARSGVQLIEITPYDLALQNLRQKTANLLPQFPVFEKRPLFRALEQLCRAYMNQMARIAQQNHQKQQSPPIQQSQGQASL